ncbi:PorT family protein [Marinilabiliaceae bacterium JC040]|nr:PorT family protein [Marinilabiliaceae bacterium JC040]
MMKKLICLALTLVLISQTLFAQDYWGKDKFDGIKKVKFGIKAGTNIASIDQGNSYDYNVGLGFYVGIVEELILNDMLSLQPEILFSRVGAKDKDDSSTTYILDYLSIPLMLKVYFTDDISFQMGPCFGFNLYSKGHNKAKTNNFTDVKKFDYSMALGAGYELNDNFSITARYSWGITEIRSKEDDRNSVFQLGACFKF